MSGLPHTNPEILKAHQQKCSEIIRIIAQSNTHDQIIIVSQLRITQLEYRFLYNDRSGCLLCSATGYLKKFAVCPTCKGTALRTESG